MWKIVKHKTRNANRHFCVGVICIAFFVSFFVQFGCHGTVFGIKTWESKFRNVSFKYSKDWGLHQPYTDSKYELSVVVADREQKHIFIVHVTADFEKSFLTDEAYFDMVRRQMLNHGVGNTLVDESETVFKGKPFHCMVFTMNNKLANLIQYQRIFIHRTGKHMICFQVAYPVEGNTPSDTPIELNRIVESLALPLTESEY